jgi:hypothetical protein
VLTKQRLDPMNHLYSDLSYEQLRNICLPEMDWDKLGETIFPQQYEECLILSIQGYHLIQHEGDHLPKYMALPQMVDENTVIIALAGGRTFANLQKNPNAVYMIVEQGAGILDWKGVRVYLRMKEYITSGPKFDTYKSQMAKIVGEQAAARIKVLATFEVTEVRPLVDFWAGLGEIHLGRPTYCESNSCIRIPIGSSDCRSYLFGIPNQMLLEHGNTGDSHWHP